MNFVQILVLVKMQSVEEHYSLVFLASLLVYVYMSKPYKIIKQE